MRRRALLSWSGGKDCCLALHTLIGQGVEVTRLITTVPHEYGRTFGHGERVELIQAQAGALGIPLSLIPTTLSGYTEDYVAALGKYKETDQADTIAYGDLYLDEHRLWGEETAARAGLEPLYPLWTGKEEAAAALARFLQSGYRAVVIRVRDDVLSPEWLGREVDQAFLEEIVRLEGVCPMGEHGEYHTLVYDGPLFRQRIQYMSGEIRRLESSWRLEIPAFALVGKA